MRTCKVYSWRHLRKFGYVKQTKYMFTNWSNEISNGFNSVIEVLFVSFLFYLLPNRILVRFIQDFPMEAGFGVLE
jgi:hypothetical protein